MSVYYDQLKAVIAEFTRAFEDKKLSLPEVWSIIVVLQQAFTEIMKEADPFTEDDCEQLIEAAQQLFDEYIRPLNLPMDRLTDMILYRWVIPGLIHGVHEALAKGALK